MSSGRRLSELLKGWKKSNLSGTSELDDDDDGAITLTIFVSETE